MLLRHAVVAMTLALLAACSASESPAPAAAEAPPDSEPPAAPPQSPPSSPSPTSPPSPPLLPDFDPLPFVDPFIGSFFDFGQMSPAASLPFGLVKLGPETDSGQTLAPYQGHSGYQYEQPFIRGFSHTRIEGIGCGGTGGAVKLRPASQAADSTLYLKLLERASPGHYSVRFVDGIQTDLTVSTRVGMHRYTWPAGASKALVHVDSQHSIDSAGFVASSLEQVDANTATGFVTLGNACARGAAAGERYHKLYYALRFDAPIVQWNADGEGKAWLDFGDAREVIAKLALSPIDSATAVEELDTDLPGWNFDVAQERAAAVWRDWLRRVEIVDTRPETAAQRRLFYTTLYRSLQLPQNVTSSSGRYRIGGDESTVRTAGSDAPRYSGWSTWDDFRKFALISMVYPETAEDIARSAAEQIAQGNVEEGSSGYWPAPTVRNEFMPAILADAWSKNLRDFDLAGAFAGGMPVTGNDNDAVEAPYASYLAMRLAEAAGLDERVPLLREGALAYRNYWAAEQADSAGPARGFFTPDGQTVPTASVRMPDAHFYQGSLWHYRYFVPHDIAGLINLRGSRELLSDELEYYFEQWLHLPSNEPPLAYPYLFSFFGKPWLTQKWSRLYTTGNVLTLFNGYGYTVPSYRPVYLDQPAGWLFEMDDDAGAMSSQYVFQALGLYPTSVGDAYYVIGSPIFPEANLHLPGGKKFTLRALGTSDLAPYIQSATLNGEPYERPWITHEQVVAGGVLELQMGAAPNLSWGSAPELAPPSMSDAIKD